MSDEILHDLIEETASVLQRLLVTLRGGQSENGGDSYGASSGYNGGISSDETDAPNEKKLTLILKFPNCETCDDDTKEGANRSSNEDIKEINVDPLIAQQLTPSDLASDTIETFISGLVSPPGSLSAVLDKRLEAFQKNWDIFAEDISTKLEMLSNRIGLLESSSDEEKFSSKEVKTLKKQKPKSK